MLGGQLSFGPGEGLGRDQAEGGRRLLALIALPTIQHDALVGRTRQYLRRDHLRTRERRGRCG